MEKWLDTAKAPQDTVYYKGHLVEDNTKENPARAARQKINSRDVKDIHTKELQKNHKKKIRREYKRFTKEKFQKGNTKELQKKRFGVGGDLFMKREELIKPIQDRIFNAIQQVASERNYSFVFDKANQSNLLFADPKFDISDQVLRKMGITIDRN